MAGENHYATASRRKILEILKESKDKTCLLYTSYLEQKYMWASKISGAIIALLFALVLSNLSIIPTACTLYDDIIWGFAVPMGIPVSYTHIDVYKRQVHPG